MRCGNCGFENPEGSSLCAHCSTPLGAAPAGEVPYAGFWRRFAAYLIDTLIVAAGFVGVGVIAALVVGKPQVESLLLVLRIVGPWLYFALMWSSPGQASLGKMALGLKVTDEAGNRIGFGRATGRYFAQILTFLSLGIGYAMAVFTRRRQALHDKVAGTLVVRERCSASQISSAPAAPRVATWQAVLVTVGVVVFNPVGIGIMAAIAIPAYQDYIVRAQVIEGLNIAAPIKASVADAYATAGRWDDVATESLNVRLSPDAKYVSKVEVVRGAVVITYGRNANRQLAGKDLVLAPGTTSTGDVVWVCGRKEPPAGVTLSIDDAQQHTSVGAKFLPMACRAGSP
jgi:uncharacterized RDD family membrane protein YckC